MTPTPTKQNTQGSDLPYLPYEISSQILKIAIKDLITSFASNNDKFGTINIKSKVPHNLLALALVNKECKGIVQSHLPDIRKRFEQRCAHEEYDQYREAGEKRNRDPAWRLLHKPFSPWLMWYPNRNSALKEARRMLAQIKL